MTRHPPTRTQVLLLLIAVAGAASARDEAEPRVLDGFESASAWEVIASDQVKAELRQTEGVEGKALCLGYDFNGVSGYAGMQRVLPLEYPQDYEFSFHLRGSPSGNNFELKLVDADGDDVWWVHKPRHTLPRQWTQVRYKKRHIVKAWGPSPN